jgi:hypothetical protein
MARKANDESHEVSERWNPALAWAFTMERVTGIELALSA